jgi:hypothetical protein
MKALIATAVALVFATSASAANNGTVALRVCSVTRTAQSAKPIRSSADIMPRVFVNGRPLAGEQIGKWSARWSGYGVVAQFWQSRRFAPFTFRVASVRSDCANVRLNYVLR